MKAKDSIKFRIIEPWNNAGFHGVIHGVNFLIKLIVLLCDNSVQLRGKKILS
jgi:hypothetical protein